QLTEPRLFWPLTDRPPTLQHGAACVVVADLKFFSRNSATLHNLLTDCAQGRLVVLNCVGNESHYCCRRRRRTLIRIAGELAERVDGWLLPLCGAASADWLLSIQ